MFYAKNFISLRRLSRFISNYFNAVHFCNVHRSRKLQKNNKICCRSKFKVIQGQLKLSMLTSFKSSLLVLIMISSMYVPICNCFHAID